MPEKEFAAEYERNKDGWILFPSDVTWRRKLFPDKVFEHPAKANMHLVKALVEYLTEPGHTILDPFAGTGTLMIARLEGRNVVLIDIETHYAELIEEAAKSEHYAEATGSYFLFVGDCRQQLQSLKFLCDAAIFSPPYSTALSHSTAMKAKRTLEDGRVVTAGRSAVQESLSQYGLKESSPQNLARLNPFYFAHSMELVYKRMHSKLVPNAPVALISKDIMKAGVREHISAGIIRQADRGGYALQEWHKWKPPGSMQQKVMRSKGSAVVEDEDILIFRKEL